MGLPRAIGLVVNFPKSDLDPSQIYTFIGILLNLIIGVVCPTDARVQAFILLVNKFLAKMSPPAG